MNYLKLSIIGVTLTALFVITPSVSAHVVVTPSEVVTAKYQTFTISIPNEKDIPTTTVRLVIPDTIKTITPTAIPGWTITTENDAAGNTKSVTWQGGEIPPEQRSEFTFSTKSPDAVGELHWKAYQTYTDGTVASWDAATTSHSHSDEDAAGPYSITKVVAQTSEQQLRESVDASVSTSQTAIIISVISCVIALGTVFLTTRKK
ncbi:hypothetical protein A2707_05605 [Candidatus Saccharibacteria bacterium RIFCSPHIGHO2_01_FULL_45_15]|nr:MAG: hypothetical protein A2707_05605 [Candidatus Saccharibacteria bacterium RIFCSPHIGHO2_01_FULL_45_15]OGL28922.1 MAG: hypothetical protein A3C39_05820 [Candidatus Saccharibacteria bacterium RIFCSPHIGHO2_02_FULL_46_12]OGL31935.1 MAG: hypothetical protein A3E76_01550 [Candidatus Saccharibacteria bacterium RIFCSPHIGHO2_12_FULL_44_22]